jgi:hypothetical protein
MKSYMMKVSSMMFEPHLNNEQLYDEDPLSDVRTPFEQ